MLCPRSLCLFCVCTHRDTHTHIHNAQNQMTSATRMHMHTQRECLGQVGVIQSFCSGPLTQDWSSALDTIQGFATNTHSQVKQSETMQMHRDVKGDCRTNTPKRSHCPNQWVTGVCVCVCFLLLLSFNSLVCFVFHYFAVFKLLMTSHCAAHKPCNHNNKQQAAEVASAQVVYLCE